MISYFKVGYLKFGLQAFQKYIKRYKIYDRFNSQVIYVKRD